jgi:serine/threonine protein phosphatase PrpC
MERSIRPQNYMSSFIGNEILKEFGTVDWNSTIQKSINNNAISIATSIGLKRKRNEDRCAVAQITSLNANQYSLAIVCDGVGGSDLGDQAANIAIATVIEEILLCNKLMPLRRSIMWHWVQNQSCMNRY